MPSLQEIQEPIAEDLRDFERRFRDAMKSRTALLDRIMHYIIKRKGKQMRPMFTLLSARQFGPLSESAHVAASLIELLHTATLVHDDVVDGSPLRRGFFSINALWKNKIAVLVGDYLLSRGLLLAIDRGEFELLRIVSHAVREMSEGELLQLEKARDLNFSEAVYFDIIRQKTASLIAACCASGAHAGGATREEVERMRRFGELTGIAFQIKDDLFDYGNGADTGKPSGLDIKEKKLTLPLIHALQQVDRSDRRWMVRTLKHENEDSKAVARVIERVVDAGGIAHAQRKMLEYRDQALQLLHGFPETPARHSLEGLVHLTVERTK
ncbi:MAG TPA: polyprenyl synthetase family protein [Flavobacteriales bacterium]|nr:polyprenyl synthetase family protein [Flavobacteriales bacterium]MCB9201372.1 polyprenyl synthetase family protein [Flavobacteriales bacterium]HOP42695.1 polyprenyl synthetase family protein [Flavobacteriales bacterium]HPF66462.1 polyprenyl synthetase family protein [Flavobacteriales bacterium]HPQ57902.1 polyprenyl synthetase family protein [Flavobacteriales bacterium]